jgi:hypothetical protein
VFSSPSCDDAKKSNFRNVIFLLFIIPDDGQSPQNPVILSHCRYSASGAPSAVVLCHSCTEPSVVQRLWSGNQSRHPSRPITSHPHPKNFAWPQNFLRTSVTWRVNVSNHFQAFPCNGTVHKVKVPGYRKELYCFLWGTNWIYVLCRRK